MSAYDEAKNIIGIYTIGGTNLRDYTTTIDNLYKAGFKLQKRLLRGVRLIKGDAQVSVVIDDPDLSDWTVFVQKIWLSMNFATRHFPLFVDHDEEDVIPVQFETTEDLLDIEWVAKWRQVPGFQKFEIHRANAFTLIALRAIITNNNPRSYAVAWLAKDTPDPVL